MNRLLRSAGLSLLCVVLSSVAASAQTVIFDHGPASGTWNNNAWTNETNGQNFADRATLSGAATVTAVRIYTLFAPFATNVHVKILADAGGVPGTLLYSEDKVPDSWTAAGGGLYEITVNLTTPFVATAGTTYWYGISGNTGDIAQASVHAPDDDRMAQFNSSTYVTLTNTFVGDQMFQLIGTVGTDLSITKTGPATVTGGGTADYQITVSNAGSADAQNVVMEDVIPAGTTFGAIAAPAGFSCSTPAVGATGTVSCTAATLTAGTSAAFTLTLQIDANLGQDVTNTATVTSDTTDSAPENNSATAVSTTLSADLSITKSGPSYVNAGGTAEYQITVSNAGPGDAQNVVMQDVIPAGTTFGSIVAPAGFTCTTPAAGATGTISCSAATLAAGASAGFTLTLQVDSTLAQNATIANTATVTSDTLDATPANNAAAAVSPAVVPSAPTASEWALLSIAFGLAAFGALRLRG